MRPPIPKILFVLFMAAFPAATPILAQGRCEISDTLARCVDRYLERGAYVEDFKKQEQREVEGQSAGIDTGGANLGTNKKNFLPLMALSTLLGQSTTDDTTGTVVYDLNFLIPKLAPKGSKNSQLQAVVSTQPKISDALRTSLSDAGHDDLIGPLEERLGDLADYRIRFTYNHSNARLGRNFAPYAQGYKALCDAALESSDWREDAGVPMDDLVAGLAEEFPEASSMRTRGSTFEDLPANERWETLLRVEAKARELAAASDQLDREASVTRIMNISGLTSYDELLDNQPQFHVTVEKRFRDPLVGTEELGVKVTYELGMVNLNESMDKECRQAMYSSQWGPKEGEMRADQAAQCLSDYMSYVKAKEVQEELEKDYRFSFSGEYLEGDGEALDVGLPTPFVLDSVRKLVLSLGLHRKLNVGGVPFDFDLLGSYEDVSDDPDRQDRGIARLTFTRKVGEMSVPFGIVFANHGEFLGDVDARLSAHVGLLFNMSGGNDDE